MFKKKISIFLIPMMMMALSSSNMSVLGATSTIKVQAFNVNTTAASNTINPKFKIVNTSSAAINLSDIKLRYYYTQDGTQQQSFWCDNSGMTSNGNYVNETGKVTGQFGKLSTTTSTADTYLEVGFTTDAGQLPIGGTIEIQSRFARTDWSNYNQANDYSFNSTATQYTDTDKVTAYIAGTLVSGIEPSGQTVLDSTISPTSVTFDKNVPADIAIKLTLNGNTLKEVDKGTGKLVSGTDYTLASDTVTLNKSYLANLADGSNSLTFKFSAGADATLTVVTTPISKAITMTVGKVTGKPGDNVIVPINFGNTATNNVLGTNFSVGYDSSLLDVVSVASGAIVLNPTTNFAYANLATSNKVNLFFCDETYGSKLINTNGIFANITFKIKGTTAVVTPITITDGAVADINGNAISATVTNGSITIAP
jgi:hypothetical protein